MISLFYPRYELPHVKWAAFIPASDQVPSFAQTELRI